MKKKVIIYSFIMELIYFSAMATQTDHELCPQADNITATKPEKNSNGTTSIFYCFPSAIDCQWKGFDPMAQKSNKIKKVLHNDKKPIKLRGFFYCDYILESDERIRMIFNPVLH